MIENMKEVKHRVIIYCRVENPDNADMALEIQKSMLRKYAVKKGYEVVAEICETATGCSTDRDGIRGILSLAGKKAMDEVLAVGYSRYSRNMEELLFLKYKIEVQHIKLNALREIPAKTEWEIQMALHGKEGTTRQQEELTARYTELGEKRTEL